MKKPIKMWSLSIGWTNPYTQPPDGLPRRLLNIKGRSREVFAIREVLHSVVYPALIGSGYGVLLTEITERRTWSKFTKAKYRTTLQTTKAKAKYPLFWEHIMKINKDRNPEYYRGE